MIFSRFIKDVDVIKTNIAPETEFDFLTHDSKKCSKRVPFICLRGEHRDGHEFIEEAVKRGAAVICEEAPQGFEGKYIQCKSTRAADAQIHSNLAGNPERRLKIIGVTGTNGKTSVCHMIKAILEKSGKRCAMTGTVKNYIGGMEYTAQMTTPMPCDLYGMMKKAVEAGDEYFITEVSSHALEYDKFHPVTFTLSVFTNLTPEHLDFHKTMEGYAEAKSRLFSKSLISIINEDDGYGKYMYERSMGLRYYFSSLRVISDFTSQDKTNRGSDGIEYDLLGENEAIHIISHIPGEFSFSNTLAAASAARVLGIDCRDIALGIRTMKGIDGRMERVSATSDIEVFIDYAHTPDALENLLKAVRGFSKEGRVILVFGCGGDRDRSKRPVMGRIAENYADYVVLTSDNTRSEAPEKIIGEILSGMSLDSGSRCVIISREEALEYAVMNSNKGDIVVVAGKGHENYEIDKNGKHSFSEKEIIKRCLKKRKAQLGKGTEKKQ